LERITNILERFGLSKLDVNVYIHLAKLGPKNEAELTKELSITRKHLHSCVNNLYNKGIIGASRVDPIIFCAFPFEKVLEVLIKSEIEQAKAIRKSRKELFSNWCSNDGKDKKINNHKTPSV